VAAFAGDGFEKDGRMHTISMHFRVGGLPPGLPWKHFEQESRRVVDAAHKEGRVPKYGGPWIIRIRDGEVTVNCTRLYGDGTSTVDFSRAEREGRRDMMTLLETLREGSSDFRKAYLLAAACQIGVRETRRITGDSQITADDVLTCRKWNDAVALGCWPIDIHPSDGRVGVHPHKDHPPEPYQIPLACLLVKDIDNLMVAGRCISATHEAHGSTRVSGTAMALGHVAGTAAALACRDATSLRKLPLSRVQQNLLDQKAILDRAS